MITDKINHPSHYTSHPSGVECIEITEGFSFNIGNAIKYLWRADEKGAPIDDLQKAQWYLTREITRRIDAAKTISEIELPEPAEKPVDYCRWLNLRALLIAAGRGDDQARRMADAILDNLEKGSLDGLVTKSDSLPNLTGNTLAYAQAGDARRQYQMGVMCYYGDGMPQDYEAAIEWWKKAAEQGNYDAQVSLVNAYRKGTGVEKNGRLANYWLEQAGSQRTEEEAQ